MAGSPFDDVLTGTPRNRLLDRAEEATIVLEGRGVLRFAERSRQVMIAYLEAKVPTGSKRGWATTRVDGGRARDPVEIP